MRLRNRRLAGIAGRLGIPLGEEQARELIDGSWQAHVEAWRRGEVFGPRRAAQWIVERLSAGNNALTGATSEIAAAIEDAAGEVGTRIVEGAGEVVEALRSAGVATALVCDTGFTPSRHVRKFLDEHGLRLDHYFFSDEVGAPKPYPPIFQAALRAIGSEPKRTIHIGDLRRTDIAGARAAGMTTIRFAGIHDDGWGTEDTEGEEADAVIHRWAELPPLIGLTF